MTAAELYPLIKASHIGLALLSGGLFAARGVGVLMGSAVPMAAPVRYLSQGIDSALLLAALSLLAILHLNPFATPWLLVKLALLVIYIGCGTLALQRAPTRAGRTLAFIVALGCFGAMVVTARSHDPLGAVRFLL